MSPPEDRALSRRQVLALLGATAAATASLAGADARAAAGELRIGYQKSSVNLMVTRERRLLASRLPGTGLKWVEFPAGPQILEALSVGSLDIGFTGDTPPVFAQAAGKDIWYVGLEPPKPANSAILVPATSSLHALSDLKGRRVAFQKGSSAHYLVVRALDKAGLQWSDITPLYLTPSDARGVGLSSNNSFYLASKALTRQPLVLKALFDSVSEADAWTKANLPATAKFLSEATGVPLAGTIRFLARRTAGPVTPLRPADIADQQRVADAFSRLGLIPKPLKVADVVWKT
jgi:sulfonate transport system substrate-binding protein